MILVDTSVWADHLRSSDDELIELLDRGAVLTHTFVIEELACGYLPERDDFLRMIHRLPQAPLASHRELLKLIDDKKLFGTGLGSIDIHLIASAMLANAKVLSRDKALSREASRLGLL